jgi:hypothetical protein
MTPFKALYGYDAPLISFGSTPSSKVDAVDEVLREAGFDSTVERAFAKSTK